MEALLASVLSVFFYGTLFVMSVFFWTYAICGIWMTITGKGVDQ